MLPRVSRTFALSIEALPERLREPVRVSYLLCRIVDTIEDQPGLSPELRRRCFDAFDETLLDGTLPADVLEALAPALDADPAEQTLCARSGAVFRCLRAQPAEVVSRVVPHVHDMSLGMRMYAMRAEEGRRPGIRDIEDLARYCYYVAGTVGELLTELFELHAPLPEAATRERLRGLAWHFGVGLQLVNIVKDVAEDHARGVVYLPEAVLERHGLSRERLLDPSCRASGVAAIRDVCAHARQRLESARLYARLWPLPEGEAMRLFCAVPLLLALATLDEVEKGEDTLRPGVSPRVSRSLVTDTLTRALAAIHDDGAYGRLLEAPPLSAASGVL
jgi:farnesyl-diphosphate farnesyltransferase